MFFFFFFLFLYKKLLIQLYSIVNVKNVYFENLCVRAKERSIRNWRSQHGKLNWVYMFVQFAESYLCETVQLSWKSIIISIKLLTNIRTLKFSVSLYHSSLLSTKVKSTLRNDRRYKGAFILNKQTFVFLRPQRNSSTDEKAKFRRNGGRSLVIYFLENLKMALRASWTLILPVRLGKNEHVFA